MEISWNLSDQSWCEKNSVCDLQYGPKTQLIRDACIYTQ